MKRMQTLATQNFFLTAIAKKLRAPGSTGVYSHSCGQ